MTFPLWAVFGLASSAIVAVTMLLQEKHKVNGFALAFWNKVGTILAITPFVIAYGVPQDPLFYLLTICSSSLYAISDVAYFNGISKAGAGAVARVLPAAVIFSFLVWLAVDPVSLETYKAAPAISISLFGVLCLWAYSASRLRKCSVSMEAARLVWFVIFAAIVGPPLGKKILNLVDLNGIYSFVFFQALFMLVIWAGYFVVKKPITSNAMFSPAAWKNGVRIGLLSGIAVYLSFLAMFHVDNPAFVTALAFLNAVFILGWYKFTGRKSDGNVTAGLVMVACAAVLILLQSKL